MYDSPTRRQNLSSDPIINFYAHELSVPCDDLPETFPEENQTAFFLLVDQISEKEKYVVTAFYGLDGNPRKSMAQIAVDLSPPVSRSRVDDILKHGVRMLRGYARQFYALLHTKAYYEAKIRQLQNDQSILERRIQRNPQTKELLVHIAKAAELLDSLEKSDDGKALAEGAQTIHNYDKKIVALIRPIESSWPIPQKPLNILEDTRQYVDQLVKFSRWIEDGKIVLPEYDDSVKAPIASETESNPEDSIVMLNFSVRAYNCLVRKGVSTISELSTKTQAELITYRNMGKKTLKEIVDRCASIGIVLPEK